MTEEEIDPACSKCNIPLRIISNVEDGKCVNVVACLVRQQILKKGSIHILSPEGVTLVEEIRDGNH